MTRYFYSKASGILFFLCFMAIGGLGYGWFVNYQTNLRQEQMIAEKMMAFMNKGKRFTATDGQDLCLRIQQLERDRGLKPFSCNYDQP